MTTPFRAALALCIVPTVVIARLEVLTVGKLARFENGAEGASGTVRVGALRELHDPRCPATSRVDITTRVESTARRALVAVDLDCAKWQAHGRGWRYRDPAGAVRTIRYARSGLRIAIDGPGVQPVESPVNVLQVQLVIGEATLRARFQDFRTDAAGTIVTRRPSRDAAAGEAAFFDVLLGDATDEERQQTAITALERAVKRSRHDGRSRFLLGMLHLYRFRRIAPDAASTNADVQAEIRASDELLQQARRLLWDGTRGDSRILVFAAIARYFLGVATHDATIRAQGVADIAAGSRANPLFNTVGYHFVAGEALRTTPEFSEAFAAFDAYNAAVDPTCFITLPELCANPGMAPHNFPGSPLLIGDIYAKSGNLPRAQQWYAVARAFSTPDYRFNDVIEERQQTAAERVARYLDTDPTNDPPVVGAGREACAICHKQ